MTVFSSGVLSAIREFNMIQPGDRVLVCLSGGADSVCLLSVLSELSDKLGIELFAAHYNHRLRGSESDGDEEFCLSLCRGLGIPLYIGSGDVRSEAERRSQGIEECARDMRYAFFYETAAALGGAKIATAHNAEDNLETVLMRVARGTGLKGLCGIPPVRGDIIRPLLYTKRADIEAYLRVNGIPHREDSSNETDDYFRNTIRHRAIPALRASSADPAASAANMTRLLREDESFLDSLSEKYLAEHPTLSASELSSQPFSLSSRVIRKAAGSELSFAHVEAVLELLKSPDPSASLDLPGLTVRREYDRLIFGQAESVAFEPFAISPGEEREIPEAGLKARAELIESAGEIHKSFTDLVFKSECVCGNMLIRPRKTGDFIRLSSGSGQKSLKKLFIDRKIPAHLRASVPVICDDAGVLGVYGIGTDVRSRAEKGDRVIKISFEDIK